MKRYKDLKTEQLAGALEEQLKGQLAVSYTHLTLPTKLEV